MSGVALMMLANKFVMQFCILLMILVESYHLVDMFNAIYGAVSSYETVPFIFLYQCGPVSIMADNILDI